MSEFPHTVAALAAARTRQSDSRPVTVLVLCGFSRDDRDKAGTAVSVLHRQGYDVALGFEGGCPEAIEQADIPRFELHCTVALRPGQYSWLRSALSELGEFCSIIDEERALIAKLAPDLIIASGRPSAIISASFAGVDFWEFVAPEDTVPNEVHCRFLGDRGGWEDLLIQYARYSGDKIKNIGRRLLVADFPIFHTSTQLIFPCDLVGPLFKSDGTDGALTEAGHPFANRGVPTILVDLHRTYLNGDLAHIAAEVNRLPCNLIIGANGRAGPSRLGANTYVTSALETELAARGFDLYLGPLTIGLAYSLIGSGIPVAGFARYPEERPCLDKIFGLRLGLEVDQGDLILGKLAELVRGLLSYMSALQVACRNFAASSQGWWFGEKVADAVARHAEKRTQGAGFVGSRLITYSELSGILEQREQYVEKVDGETKLRSLMESGLPHVQVGSSPVFEWGTTLNFLFDNDPDFFEGYMNRRFEGIEETFVLIGDGTMRCKERRCRYCISYRLSLDLSALDAGCPVRVFLGYPVPTPSQKDIRLLSCSPASLAEYHAPHLGFFYGFKLEKDADAVELSYAFEITLEERRFQKLPAPVCLSAQEEARYLEVPQVLRYREDVAAFLDKHLPVPEKLNDEQRARCLYEGLFRENRWRSGNEKSSMDFAASLHEVLASEGGHCITLIRSFIALCRLVGVPAREVRGVTLEYPYRDHPGFVRYGGEEPPPFHHIFAEVFLKEYGWIPVESESVAISSVGMNERNVRCPELRAKIEKWTEPSIDYFFGNLEFNNLEISPNTIPLCMAPDEGGSGVLVPINIPLHCEQTCECI